MLAGGPGLRNWATARWNQYPGRRRCGVTREVLLACSLHIRAAHPGRSMEADARLILRSALDEQAALVGGLAESIRRRFAPLGGVELDPPPREPIRERPGLGERSSWILMCSPRGAARSGRVRAARGQRSIRRRFVHHDHHIGPDPLPRRHSSLTATRHGAGVGTSSCSNEATLRSLLAPRALSAFGAATDPPVVAVNCGVSRVLNSHSPGPGEGGDHAPASESLVKAQILGINDGGATGVGDGGYGAVAV